MKVLMRELWLTISNIFKNKYNDVDETLEDDKHKRLLILTEKDQKTYIELQEQYDREISRANATLRKIGWLIVNSEVEEEKMHLLDREVEIIRGLKNE